MSAPSQPLGVKLVDSIPALQSAIDKIADFDLIAPPVFVDLEGIKLGRHGSVSIMSLYIAAKNTVFLFDIHGLGNSAFITSNKSGTSLKRILESSSYPKIFFDVRNDSDALFNHFGILLDGVQDLQLMELATRGECKRRVTGLAKCIEYDSGISATEKAEWQQIKETGTRLFSPEKGGRYQVFNERPLRPEIVNYCVKDVMLLPKLYEVYRSKLRPPGQRFWQVEVEMKTKDRVKLAQNPKYDPQADNKVLGPWTESYLESAIDAWNDNVMDEAIHGDDDEYEEDDYWLEDDTNARDCIGWEEDMERRGSPF